MSYLDEEIIDDFKKINTNLIIMTESEYDFIINNINENIPFSVNNVAWNLLKNSAYLGVATSPASMELLTEKIESVTEDSVIIVGDSTDNAYSINVKDLPPALQIFSTIPQHTYITQERLDWIACISFEKDIYFSTL